MSWVFIRLGFYLCIVRGLGGISPDIKEKKSVRVGLIGPGPQGLRPYKICPRALLIGASRPYKIGPRASKIASQKGDSKSRVKNSDKSPMVSAA